MPAPSQYHARPLGDIFASPSTQIPPRPAARQRLGTGLLVIVILVSALGVGGIAWMFREVSFVPQRQRVESAYRDLHSITAAVNVYGIEAGARAVDSYSTKVRKGYRGQFESWSYYPADLHELGPDLLGEALASGDHNGYIFTYRSSSSGGHVNSFSVVARPKDPRQPWFGDVRFFMDDTGVIRIATGRDPDASSWPAIETVRDGLIVPML